MHAIASARSQITSANRASGNQHKFIARYLQLEIISPWVRVHRGNRKYPTWGSPAAWREWQGLCPGSAGFPTTGAVPAMQAPRGNEAMRGDGGTPQVKRHNARAKGSNTSNNNHTVQTLDLSMSTLLCLINPLQEPSRPQKREDLDLQHHTHTQRWRYRNIHAREHAVLEADPEGGGDAHEVGVEARRQSLEETRGVVGKKSSLHRVVDNGTTGSVHQTQAYTCRTSAFTRHINHRSINCQSRSWSRKPPTNDSWATSFA